MAKWKASGVEAQWAEVADKIRSGKPNGREARRKVERFIEANSRYLVDFEEQLSALDEYDSIERSDFEDAEAYQEARAEAWQAFLDSLDGVDFAEPEDEEEPEPEPAKPAKAEKATAKKETTQVIQRSAPAATPKPKQASAVVRSFDPTVWLLATEHR